MSMRRLSTLFLVCFVAVLFGLSGMIAWRVMGRRPPPPVQQPPQQAEYQIKEIHINEPREGHLGGHLTAARAEVYDQKGIPLMRRVTVQVFSKEGDWPVTSDDGPLDNTRRAVALKGNVITRSSDGLEMRTATLGWDNE